MYLVLNFHKEIIVFLELKPKVLRSNFHFCFDIARNKLNSIFEVAALKVTTKTSIYKPVRPTFLRHVVHRFFLLVFDGVSWLSLSCSSLT